MRNAAAALSTLAVLAAAGMAPAQQQQAPTPIPQNVVVPSLPDQPNKEGVVRPGGAMQSDSAGWVQTSMGEIDPNAAKATPPAGRTQSPAGGPGPGIVAMPPPPASGPRGKPVVDAAYLTIRGVVKGYAKGVSITVVEANGRKRTVPLAEKAVVYEGVAVGDKVVLRLPLQDPADGKRADRVERQKPAKAPPASKFSQAQSPKG